LSAAPEFAANLLSLKAADVTHIRDSTKQQVDLVDAQNLPALLDKEPQEDRLSRFVLLLDDKANSVCVEWFLCQKDTLGKVVNAIYFSQSKYQSKTLAMVLDTVQNGRQVMVYNADLPPEVRRAIEKQLNDKATRAVTVLGTSALELGLDIEGLDVCLVDDTPPRRVGRNHLVRIGLGRDRARPARQNTG
jgi:ATP-dependent helicase YprA (DUF1998 family)